MTNESNANLLRALVVDDEPQVRRLTTMALSREGFQCDIASDGKQAEAQLAAKKYDVLVTDLQMPNRNGHALAVGLLEQADRPLIVVLTGVVEPKLAKDLMARGIDDIVFKPVDFPTFAAKVRAMVSRRRAPVTPATTTPAVE